MAKNNANLFLTLKWVCRQVRAAWADLFWAREAVLAHEDTIFLVEFSYLVAYLTFYNEVA